MGGGDTEMELAPFWDSVGAQNGCSFNSFRNPWGLN